MMDVLTDVFVVLVVLWGALKIYLLWRPNDDASREDR